MIKSITIFEKELAIKWEDGGNCFILLSSLRKRCPCAWCSGEKDVFGNTYKGPDSSLVAHAFQISRYEQIGLYGIRFFWKDGHSDGIYTIDFLKNLSIDEK